MATAAPASQAKAPALAMQAMSAPPLVQRTSRAGFVPPLASLAAIPARPAVQRTCEACGEEDYEEQGVQPRLEVGAAADPLEVEADAIAERVMASGSPATVQRICEACDEEEQEDEQSVQPRLEVGAAGDRFEVEADAIAARVMAMRASEASEASEAPETVQRACAACASSDEEARARRLESDDEPLEARVARGRVRARRAGGSAATIAASQRELTSGGEPLPSDARAFFEPRMGRDLSAVRIHRGGGAGALNRSIAARAFTYRNHIWLGSSEAASASFTMAHELAHVLQQTAPGPVGPRDSASLDPQPPVRRTFYYEEQGRSLPQTHDEVVNWLTVKDSALFAEVPVPNANRKGRQLLKKKFGRADLVSFAGSDREVPVGMSTAACPKAQKDHWYCTDSEDRTSSRKPTTLDEATIKTVKQSIIQNGTAWGKMDSDSVPRYGPILGAVPMNGFIRDAGGVERAAKPGIQPSDVTPAEVKTQLAIGDVKAGAFVSARRKAVAQIRNYMLGFQETNQLYEDVRARIEKRREAMKAEGRNDFSALPSALTPWKMGADILGSIKGVGPVQKITDTPRNIVLKRWTSDNEGGIARSENVPGATAKTGNLYIWKDTGLMSGAWSYLWSPEDSEGSNLYSALGPDPTFDALKENSHCLREALLMPASPPKPGSAASTAATASKAPACLKKMPLDGAAASPAPAVVQRGPPKKPKAPAAPAPVDPFKENFPAWEGKQTKLTTDFAAYGKSAKGGERTAALAELEARQNIAERVPGKSGALSQKGAETLKEQGSAFAWLETLGGRSGRVIGQLRLRFGGLFERLVKAYGVVKEKVQAFFAKLSPNKPGKGLGKAVLKIVAKLLGAIGNWVLPRVTQALMDCLEEGISKKLEELFADGPLAVVREKIEAAQAFAEELTDSVLSTMSGIGDYLVGDLKGTIDKIKEAADFIRDIVNIGKNVFDAVRLAICVAGGVESFGLSCAVSLVDKVLSWMGISPLEALAGSLLSTCMGQTMLTEAMMAFKAIQDLPKTIASKIVETVKGKLPEAAQGLLCDPATMVLELPKVSEVTCGSGGSPGATPGPNADGSYSKGSWTPPSGYTPEQRQKVEDLAKAEAPPAQTPPPPPEDGAPGGSPPPPTPAPEETQAPPKPEGEKGTVPPTETPAQGPGGSGTEAPDSIKQGTLDNATPATIRLEIHGGFSPTKAYDGTIAYPVHVVGKGSDGADYGPLPVNIFVFAVIKADKGWKIDFKFQVSDPSKNIILTDGKTGNSMEIFDSATLRIKVPLRPPVGAAP